MQEQDYLSFTHEVMALQPPKLLDPFKSTMRNENPVSVKWHQRYSLLQPGSGHSDKQSIIFIQQIFGFSALIIYSNSKCMRFITSRHHLYIILTPPAQKCKSYSCNVSLELTSSFLGSVFFFKTVLT